jgi:hypothetical protein
LPPNLKLIQKASPWFKTIDRKLIEWISSKTTKMSLERFMEANTPIARIEVIALVGIARPLRTVTIGVSPFGHTN